MSDAHQSAATKAETYLHELFLHASSSAHDIHPAYGRLWEEMGQVMFAGGKRFRPYLTVLGYQLGPENAVDIIPVAAAQELLHVATLMHDDIIDRDDTRHSQPNMNGRYKTIYGSYVSPGEVTHYAYSAGILAGDLLITAAHRAIVTSDFSAADKEVALDLLNTSLFEVIGGELLDVEAAFMTDQSYEALTIYEHKTAAYSLVGPLLTGARLSHASDETCNYLSTYAFNLGIAFQIQDDLLGLFGDESVTGKPTTSDIREGKKTFIMELFEKCATKDDFTLLDAALGKRAASDSDIERLKERIRSSSAYKEATTTIGIYSQNARRALEPLEESPTKQELLLLIDKLTNRTY